MNTQTMGVFTIHLSLNHLNKYFVSEEIEVNDVTNY